MVFLPHASLFRWENRLFFLFFKNTKTQKSHKKHVFSRFYAVFCHGICRLVWKNAVFGLFWRFLDPVFENPQVFLYNFEEIIFFGDAYGDSCKLFEQKINFTKTKNLKKHQKWPLFFEKFKNFQLFFRQKPRFSHQESHRAPKNHKNRVKNTCFSCVFCVFLFFLKKKLKKSEKTRFFIFFMLFFQPADPCLFKNDEKTSKKHQKWRFFIKKQPKQPKSTKNNFFFSKKGLFLFLGPKRAKNHSAA